MGWLDMGIRLAFWTGQDIHGMESGRKGDGRTGMEMELL